MVQSDASEGIRHYKFVAIFNHDSRWTCFWLLWIRNCSDSVFIGLTHTQESDTKNLCKFVKHVSCFLTRNHEGRGCPSTGSEVWAGAVPHPQRNFLLNFTSKNARFCAFLLRKLLVAINQDRWRLIEKRTGIENLAGVTLNPPPINLHPAYNVVATLGNMLIVQCYRTDWFEWWWLNWRLSWKFWWKINGLLLPMLRRLQSALVPAKTERKQLTIGTYPTT